MWNAVKWMGMGRCNFELERKSALGILAVALCQNDTSGKYSYYDSTPCAWMVFSGRRQQDDTATVK